MPRKRIRLRGLQPQAEDTQMSRYQYERLSGQDNDFLVWETSALPMHVAGVNIFQAGPLRNEAGGIDFEAIKQLTESVLHLIPRYRQKLAWIPGEDHAVWVDDEHFRLDYHFRHTSLPRPGTDEQLKTLTARIVEQPLDRSRPLWETWVIEGLEGDRFATVNKIHHCMIDGASGVELTQLLLSKSPEREIRAVPRFIPRPTPRPDELRKAERLRKFTTPIWAGRKLFEFARETPNVADEITRRAESLVGLAKRKLFPVSSTPVNGTVGPHRIVEWSEMSFADVKAVRAAVQCTVNDVVLTIVTGAIRRLMLQRQVDPAKLDFRVSTPVNVRRKRHSGASGNHVSSWIVRLPLALERPLEQLKAIRETTASLKASDEAGAVKMVLTAADALGWNVQNLSVGTMNTIVTNVPGPAFPLYLLGARLQQMMPFAPLLENLGLSIGALTYDGKLCWGLSADADRLPDLPDFRAAIERAFEDLAEAAGVTIGQGAALAELRPEIAAKAIPPAASSTTAVPRSAVASS
jgi:diacylglycerol O-acyltransferase